MQFVMQTLNTKMVAYIDDMGAAAPDDLEIATRQFHSCIREM